jgi:hypothetical protein
MLDSQGAGDDVTPLNLSEDVIASLLYESDTANRYVRMLLHSMLTSLRFTAEGGTGYPGGTRFILDCDACLESIALCDCDVKCSAPISTLLDQIEMTDWQVLRSSMPDVTTKFICPACRARRQDCGQIQLPEITGERPSPLKRIRIAGMAGLPVEIGSWKRWAGKDWSS